MHSPKTLTRLLKEVQESDKDVDFNSFPFPLFIPLGNHAVNDTALAHSVPLQMVPILDSNSKITEFFTDVTTDVNDRLLMRQVKGIVLKFPPPLPPFVPERDNQNLNNDNDADGASEDELLSEDLEEYEREYEELLGDSDDDLESVAESGGIMLPFIFPPPPVIDMDKLPFSKPNEQHEDPPEESRAPRTRASVNKSSKKRRKVRNLAYVEVPPLPFPPPHYMPYPLIAHKAGPTPEDAFKAMMDASERLPRIDMVVASAAGSLFEIESQAKEEGFEITAYEREKEEEKKLRSTIGSKKGKRRMSAAEIDDDEYQEYLEYVNGIRTDEEYDPYYKDSRERALQNTVVLSKTYNPTVKHEESHERNVKCEDGVDSEVDYDSDGLNSNDLSHLSSSVSNSPTHSNKPKSTHDLLNIDKHSNFSWNQPAELKLPEIPVRDVAVANGSGKEKRRAELHKSLSRLRTYEEKNRQRVYNARKKELVERLLRLQKSKVGLTECDINDPELKAYQMRQEANRDEELVRLKIKSNYELLQNAMLFYHDLNRNYKHMNLLLVNKLEKLKNFFEYQKNLFEGYLGQKKASVFDVRSKDSALLVKNVLPVNMSPRSPSPEKEAQAQQALLGLVHDFMPLSTYAEFNAVVGDLPTKLAQSKDVKKHKIFQSALYERATSGSDTNVSDSGTGSTGPGRPPLLGPKRGRGRRAAVQQEGVDYKYSEATLLAKIMKQFQGPQEASVDETMKDMEMMGVRSKWPK